MNQNRSIRSILVAFLMGLVLILSACGSGSSDPSSMWNQANSSLSHPEECKPSGSPGTSLGFGCGGLYVSTLANGESAFDWAKAAGANCWIEGSNWVVDGGAVGSASDRNRIVNAIGGTFQNPTGQCG
jgi:hypothetical protein